MNKTLNTVKDLIKGYAPTLATALGGPIAGTAVKFITDNVFKGENVNNLPDKIKNADIGIIDQMVKAEKNFMVEMEKLGIDVLKLETADRDSARKLFSINIWPQIVLSTIFITAYFLLMGYVVSKPDEIKPITDNQLLFGLVSSLFGVVTGSVVTIISFWFGSSKGSQDKTNLQGK